MQQHTRVQILAEAAKLVYIATQKIQKHFAEAFVEIGTTGEFTHKVCTHITARTHRTRSVAEL
jgi:hypothetical protein